MKKLLMLLLAAVIIICLCSCGSKTPDSAETTENVEPDHRRVYYDAVQKTDSEVRYGYDIIVSNVMTYPEGERIIIKNGHIEQNGLDCDAVFDDGEKTVSCAYVDGYVYSDESGGYFKAPMAENEFEAYLNSQIYPAFGAEYSGIAAAENDDGTYTVSLSGMIDIPEALAEHFQKLGMSDMVLNSISGTANIDENGYITAHAITAELSMTDSGEAVKCIYSAEVDYIIGGEYALTLPTDDEYTLVSDINTPMLIRNAYENIAGTSYDASYNSIYSCFSGSKEYSMELDYSQSVTELPAGFEASDETIIDYDTVRSGRTVEKSSEYSDGELESIDGDSSHTEEMTASSARSMYYHMLTDYEPDMKLIRNVSVKDFDEYYEVKYVYTEESAKMYCQNVLTVLLEDQEGIAVHSEAHTIKNAEGIMRIDKASGVLITHDIAIAAAFSDGEKSFTVGFEHRLWVCDSAVFEVKNVEAKAGDVIEIDVYLENNPGAAAINAELEFDTGVLTAVSAELADEQLNDDLFYTRFYDGEVKAEALWFDTENYYGSGKVMTFTFQISENATAGEYIISFNSYEDDLVNEDVECLDVTYLSGTVTVLDCVE